MGLQTSGCLYGSASTDNWVPGRSDLDLILIIPEESIGLLEQKIKKWESDPSHPIIDGYVLYSSAGTMMAKEFYKFERPARLANTYIPLIDLWNIKNKSKHLFGQDFRPFIPEISQQELKDWALKDIKEHWIPMIDNLVSHSTISKETPIPHSTLIWLASGVARIVMLRSGNICSSKLAALQWLSSECNEIKNPINQLIKDFDKPDNAVNTLSTREALALNVFYLHLLNEIQ